MAGPIKIAILAQAKQATTEVRTFARDVDTSVSSASESMGRAGRDFKRAGQDAGDGFDKFGEKADEVDTKAMGFRDTMTGVQDTMKGTALIANGDLFNGFLTLGMGIGDLGSGLYNFLVPALKSGVTAMRALNLTMLMNPIFLVIVAVVALVAVFVVAYKKSETFRRIVDGAFRKVKQAAQFAWQWIKRNWPLLLAIVTGPIGLAVRFVIRHFDTIKAKVRSIPRTIRAAFSNARSMLTGAGRNVVRGLWSGIVGMGGWLKNNILGWARSVIPGPVARALGIASPSRVMRRLGRFLPQGLALGIDDETQRVRSAAGRMASATVSPLGSAGLSGASSAGRGGTTVLELRSSGSDVDDFLVTMLRKAIRTRGGNVQVVLGRG